MSEIVRKTIKWGILAIVAYFIIGWIAKDIYFSICEWQPDETMVEVWRREIAVYTIVAAVISGLFLCADVQPKHDYDYISVGILIVIFDCRDIIPLSVGVGLLINLLNIIAMLIAVYQVMKDRAAYRIWYNNLKSRNSSNDKK